MIILTKFQAFPYTKQRITSDKFTGLTISPHVMIAKQILTITTITLWLDVLKF